MSDHPTPFAPKKKQAGPTLLSERSCYGCMYEESAPYRVQGDSGREVYCTAGVARRLVGDTSWTTPDWCPLLPSDSLATLVDGNVALASPLTEAPVDLPVMRWIAAADREVGALRQLLAQGRAVTDADLARVQGYARGEAPGVWRGRPPTLEEGREHLQKYGEEPALVLACGDGSMWMASATDTYPLAPGTGGPDLGIIDVALAAGEVQAREVAQARWERVLSRLAAGEEEP